ncbi:leucine-rich repeat domain-containing protein [Gelatiniphilus marinus]|uniref:Leucine-rich repeat domain-containing protein n=1 Tax=Gelatiniphilus marinus TaxID=1759464 RepID=A0ABW5JMN1_9FLAO
MKTQIHLYIFIALISLGELTAQSFEVDGINYNILNSTDVEVTSKTQKYTGNIIIPATVNYANTTYHVTAIGYEAFRGCLSVTSISLPNSIITIEDYAFRDCRGITSMILPDSVTSIGEGAFLYCTKLVSVNIPDKITTISMSTFAYCQDLTSITIPESVQSIGTYAFSSCDSLATVNINVVSPINITIHRFWNLDLSLITLNVPVGSESAYSASAVWQDFGSINGTLNLNAITLNNSFGVYPNPAKSNIFIPGLKQPESYVVYNALGKQVAKGSINNENSIEINKLARGLYFLKLANGYTVKFIKE